MKNSSSPLFRRPSWPHGVGVISLIFAAACISEPQYEGLFCQQANGCPKGFSCGDDLRCHSSATMETSDPGAWPDASVLDAEGMQTSTQGDAGADVDARDPGAPDGGAKSPPDAASSLAPNNPFAGASFYANPDLANNVDRSIALAPEETARLMAVRGQSTAVWISRIDQIAAVSNHLAAADAQATREGKPVLVMLVLNDIPDRTCPAPNGELRVASDGATRYKAEVVEPLAAEIAHHPALRVALVLEPSTIPHLVTGSEIPSCRAAAQTQRELLAFAIDRFSKLPNVSIYLDVAHGSWLGWPDHRSATARVVRELLQLAGGAQKIRGFTTNVANFNVLTEQPELFDYQANPCHDEMIYANLLAQDLAVEGITGAHFVIDTSRNGKGGIRKAWSSYCNVQGAGLGERPRADPAPGVDAYFWVKTPGESDGSTDMSSPSFNPDCAKEDSTPNAPEAGQWFHAYFMDLIKNAVPPL